MKKLKLLQPTESTRNPDLITLGLETLALGIYFMVHHPFHDNPHNFAVHASFLLPSPFWLLIVLVLGLTALLVGLTEQWRFWLDSMILIVMGAVWAVNAVALAVQDYHFSHSANLSTVLAVFVVIKVFTSSRYNGRRLK